MSFAVHKVRFTATASKQSAVKRTAEENVIQNKKNVSGVDDFPPHENR